MHILKGDQMTQQKKLLENGAWPLLGLQGG
jgi:hypothetical protein